MFTGIVETKGEVIATEGAKYYIKCSFLHEVYIGQSIAHDGICLTVSAINKDSYVIELIPETVKRTHFKRNN